MVQIFRPAVIAALLAIGLPTTSLGQSAEDLALVPFPDLETSVAQYEDPTVPRRKSCVSHPGRPGWVMIHAQGLEWRAELAMLWKQRWSGSRVDQAQECTCDMLYPDFDAHRSEIEALWDSVGGGFRSDWTQEAGENFYKIRADLAAEARSYARVIGRLCARPE